MSSASVIRRLALSALMVFGTSSFVGCSPSTPSSKPGAIVVTAKITGAPEVKKALETKDYEGVLKALGTAGASVKSDADQTEYRKLTYEVLDGLRLYRDNDPKAEETFQTVRGMVMGR